MIIIKIIIIINVGIFEHANSNLRSMIMLFKECLYAATFEKQVIMVQTQHAAGSKEEVKQALSENLLKIHLKGFPLCH